MSDPYNSNGLPDPVRPDRPASARPINPRRHRKMSVGDFFERWLIAWNLAGLAVSVVLSFSGRNQGSFGGVLFMAWPFLLALAVRFWVTNSLACLVARSFTALWGLFLFAQFLRYSMYGITTPKTLMLLTLAVLIALNAVFLKPAPQRD
ncbi:hypothetical protein [Lysobacter sp. Root690]|uniref:hypothetical protein n=1 Tax=Lysobacter sp. Root690 TaxID=1736588 RepID=UPI0012F9B110|nr:hypothetical protein [Lysobacter sp. Root690]